MTLTTMYTPSSSPAKGGKSMSELDRQTRTVVRWTRRRLLLATSAVTGAAVLAACQAPASAPPAATKPPAAGQASGASAPRWGMTAQQETEWQQVEAAGRKEGKLTYYSLGSIPESKADALKAAFAKDYPGIEITYLNVGNTSTLFSRLTAEQDSKTYVADTFDTGPAVARDLAEHLAAFTPPVVSDKSVKWLYDPMQEDNRSGLHRVEVMQMVILWINTNLVKAGEAPKGYADLVDPKWKGQITWREPWAPGGGLFTYIYGKQTFGEEWIAKMQAQNPVIAANQDTALQQVARGEHAIGMGLTGRTAAQLIKEGQPLAPVWPAEFAINIPVGTYLLKNAPNPNAARVFCNWMLTPAGQTLWRDIGQFPVRADVPPAEPWMAGITNAKIVSAVIAPDVMSAEIKNAESRFKR